MTKLNAHAEENWPPEDKIFAKAVIADAYSNMQTHLEIFDMPSGRQLYLWADGRYELKENKPSKLKEFLENMNDR